MTTVAQQYTAHWRPIIEPIANKYGINPDFVLTQIAQESQWGTRTPKGSNNFAGIQDFRKKSDGVVGRDAGRLRKFRKFDREEAFAEHYINMLSRLYPGTVGAKTIQDFASALQDGKRRYAEAGHYKDALTTVYNDHYANGSANQPVTPTTEVTGGQTYQAGTGLVDYATALSQGGVKLSASIPKQSQDKDPLAELWNVKPPQETERQPAVRIADGHSPYRSSNLRFQWGLDK